MTSLVSTLIGLAFLLLAWRSWQQTMLDEARDRLFDMRDSLRDHFATKPRGLRHPIYRELRGLLNAHLRGTERMRFVGFVWFSRKVNPEIVRYLNAQIESRFQTNDKDLAKQIHQIRTASARTMQKYMICTSSFAMLLVLTCVPVALYNAARSGVSHLSMNLKRAMVTALDATVISPERFEWATQLKAA